MRRLRRGMLWLLAGSAIGLSPGPAPAQSDRGPISALVSDLRSADFETAQAAVEALARYPEHRHQIVPSLVEAIRTGEWPRCAGDMRDAIARTLVALKAKEAVEPLLALVKSGRNIDHECLE